MQLPKISALTTAVLLSLTLAGCAAQTDEKKESLVDLAAPELTCQVTSNCVNSLGNSEFTPLGYTGTPEKGLALLRLTLDSFPEAKVIQSSPTWLKVIFTTSLGFRDEVVFVINAQPAQIQFRSKSLLGLYDFGKNAARMRDFRSKFIAVSK